jgi:hypothetical protein
MGNIPEISIILGPIHAASEEWVTGVKIHPESGFDNTPTDDYNSPNL